jgi:hypothetical protein
MPTLRKPLKKIVILCCRQVGRTLPQGEHDRGVTPPENRLESKGPGKSQALKIEWKGSGL